MADDDDDVAEVDAGGGGDIDAGGGGEFQSLITGEWTLPGGTEDYRCVYKTIERDTYATAFRPVIPLGTHHTVLTIGPKNREDGVYTCNAGTNYGAQVYGSGVGTNALHLPDGIAVKLSAGDQLLLNLHLFNFADTELIGTSGTEFVEVDAAEVDHIAEGFMVSKFDLLIPTGGESVQSGACTLSQPTTLISVAPHMHMLGTHMKIVAQRSAGDITLLDEPYEFDEQIVRLLPQEVAMQAGDQISIECTYNNTTGQAVRFGDSSNEEMCISGHFRYPAQDGGLFCNTGF